MQHFTIDQAGKIEQTNEDTILALCSKNIQYTIKIPKQLKQKIFSQCHKRFKKNLTFRTFSYGVCLLIKNKINQNSLIMIDNEYPGHERDIKQYLLKFSKLKKSQIKFTQVGKKDASHRIANQTFSGKLKPNEIILTKNLTLKNILPEKKLKQFLK